MLNLTRVWMIAVVSIGLLWLSLAACSPSRSQRLDPANIKLLNVIELPDEVGSERIAVTAKGYAYIMNWSGSITILDGPKLVSLLALPKVQDQDSLRGQIAVHPQTDLVYVTDQLNHVVHVLDGLEIVATITDVGFNPYALTILPRTGYVYVGSHQAVPNTLGATISVITNTQVITRIPIGLDVKVITADETSDSVYVGQLRLKEAVFPQEEQTLLAVIEGTSLITMTSLGYGPEDGSINAIKINPNTGEIYMIENLATLVYWHGDVVERLYLGRLGYTGLNDIAIDPKRNLVYVSSWGDTRSHVVVLKKDQIVDALVVGRDPRQIVVDETRDAIYVANRLSGSIAVIRGTEVLSTVKTRGNGPMYLGLDEQRGYLYAANSDSHNISVFALDKAVSQP